MKKILLLIAAVSLTNFLIANEIKTRELKPQNASIASSIPVTRDLSRPVADPAHGFTPISFSLFPGASLPPESWSVFFLRINIITGRHRDVYGFDIGTIGNEVIENFVGIQLAGFYNKVGRSNSALQFAGLINRCQGDFTGMQIATLQNTTDGTMTGFQFGILNRVSRLDGLQIGLVNVAETGTGIQIGLWNSARSLEGLQIGVANCNTDSTIPFFPVINFAF